MKRTFLLLTLLSACGLGVFAQETLEPQAGVLLLRNGEILEGRISFEGDYCTIILKHGEIRVRRNRVTAVEASIDAIYRKHIIPNSLDESDGSLTRADWCLRHGLLGHAEQQITQAAKQTPHHPRLAVLRERLAVARRPPTPKKRVVKEEDGEQPLANTSPAARQHAAASLSAKSLETFTIAVQPLLLNRCATAACHGKVSKSAYRLERGIPGRAMLRSVTLSNLESTLRFVDRKRPTASPLLTTPIRPHASAKQAVFLAVHRKQYELLARWVEQIAATNDSPAVVSRRAQPTNKQPRGIDSGTKTLGRRLPDLRDLQRSKPHTPDIAKPTSTRPSHIDPFDPEQFNRRFFKSRKPKEVAPAWQPKAGLPGGSG